jgi:hypothetical protein
MAFLLDLIYTYLHSGAEQDTLDQIEQSINTPNLSH